MFEELSKRMQELQKPFDHKNERQEGEIAVT